MKDAGDIDVIKAMLSKAAEKLKTARIDYDNDRYDDSVSRAYYAVYHAISAVLLSKGLHFSSHGQTIGAFNKEFVKTKEFPPFYKGDSEVQCRKYRDGIQNDLHLFSEGGNYTWP